MLIHRFVEKLKSKQISSLTKLGYEISMNFGHWNQVCLIKQLYTTEIQLLVQLLPNPEKIKYSFSQKLEKIYANEGNYSTVSFIIKVFLLSFKHLQDFRQTPSASVVQESILRVHVLFYAILSLWHIVSAFHFLASRTFHNFLFNVFCLLVCCPINLLRILFLERIIILTLYYRVWSHHITNLLNKGKRSIGGRMRKWEKFQRSGRSYLKS